MITAEYGHQLVSFAAPLKRMVRGMFEDAGLSEKVIREAMDGDLKEVPLIPFGCSPRYMMQKLGVEWGRDMISKSLWVDVLLNRVANQKAFVVDDMRFPNEYNAMRYAGAYMVKVDRPFDDAYEATHSSEGALDRHDFDAVIYNDGSISDLSKRVGTSLFDR